ncbi:MAG: arylsulfatase [Verrucomicrobiota bacterium]
MRNLVLLLSSLLLASASLAGAGANPRPNIVIMMADDMGIGDCSAYLGKRLGAKTEPIARTLRTPNLEAFARDGVVFTQAHAPASMCSATRYSLLTGRFAHRAYLKHQGWLPHGPNTPMIQRGLITLSEMLQELGYHTAAIGKYHVGMAFPDGHGGVADEFDFSDVDFTKPILDGPTHHGFDEFFGVPGNTEERLDTEPRIYIRNDRWTVTDRSRMKRLGMNRIAGRVLAAPDWELSQLGPDFLTEALAFVERQARSTEPFFLYYVPCANHLQAHPGGKYAVPDHIGGKPIKGQSRYSDGSPGGDREDMVLENDTAFGLLLEKLRDTDDPRASGRKLIDNTLIIFTSDNGPNVGDNLGRNEESGGLRGKKAKIWEGGIRVPFVASLPDTLEKGSINDGVFSLTDLYATVARLAGRELNPHEAQDSHDSLAHWLGQATEPDDRPRVFFCHLGPPFSNDTLALRRGHRKLLVDGGLALPSIAKGKRGASMPRAYYDLKSNPYEEGEGVLPEHEKEAQAMARQLLEIHNRGYARDLELKGDEVLVLNEGWHNLRNDLDGEVGYEFALRSRSGERTVTHLGMWDDHARDRPTRPARSIPDEHGRDQPGRSKGGRGLKAAHTVRLLRIDETGPVTLAKVLFSPDRAGKLEGAFRYRALEDAVALKPGRRYALLLSVAAEDGDHFRDVAAFDGLSPLTHPAFEIVRSLLVRSETNPVFESLPAFSDLDVSYSRFRLPVGPTLRASLPAKGR